MTLALVIYLLHNGGSYSPFYSVDDVIKLFWCSSLFLHNKLVCLTLTNISSLV
jgi:hypothetical protein